MRGAGFLALAAGTAAIIVNLWSVAAAAERRETLAVSSRFHGRPLRLPVRLMLPARHDGERVPAMVIVHGSGGVRSEREYAYAREILKLGVAAAVIDSFTPRGVGSTVRDQSKVSAVDMLVDAVSTLKALSGHPAIDPARIGVIGFSKGGTVVVKAALQGYMTRFAGAEPRFALLIALYPWCGDQPYDFRAASAAPLHMLLGGADTYTGTESCLEYGRKFEARGGKLTLKIYPGAQHGWDTPNGAHWFVRTGENYRRCIYDETAPGHWAQRGSGIVIVDKYKPTGKAKQAAARCMTRGVSGGYGKQAHLQSLADIRGFMRETFGLGKR